MAGDKQRHADGRDRGWQGINKDMRMGETEWKGGKQRHADGRDREW